MKSIKELLTEEKVSRKLITEKMIQEAREEFKGKDEDTIQRETAIKWGARYLASREIADFDSETFLDEALEHSALTRDIKFCAQLFKELGL